VRERKSAEFSGKNVEEAISRALTQLGLTRDDIETHIISPGSRGVLGIGAESARVSVSYYVEIIEKTPPPGKLAEPAAIVAPSQPIVADVPPMTVSEPAAHPHAPAQEETLPPAVEMEPESETLSPIKDEAEFQRLQALSIEVAQHLLEGMGIRANVVPLPPQGLMAEQASEGPAIILDIRGEDLGILIGRRGETLASLQYMTRLIVSRQVKQWLNILLDVEQYRARRERGLRQLALRMAERAAASHQPVPLEAMTSYDRRVVHLTLHENQHVTTKSVGEGDSRKVVIIPLD
jgi:spoIIIJ-associated protein